MDQSTDDIEAWKRVHQQLTMAIVQSRDNIAVELCKRRYLLEEMNRCKMQTNSSLRSYAKKKKAKITPPSAVEANNTTIQAPTQGDVQKDVEQITDIALGSMVYNQPPIGMSTANYDAMQLAFQMMEQMNNQNKSKSTEEESGDNEDEDTEDDKTE